MARTETPEIIRIILPSRLPLLAVLDRLCLAVCEQLEFDEDAASQVNMAVIEAGTNAIQHGHQRDASKMFDAAFLMWPDRLEVVVHDSGPGFDLSTLHDDITSPERLLEPRGRGIYIMRACMDSVDFRFDEAGTTCTLVKQRRAAAAASG
jgi:serine/threonine-protein kinase RsbW